MNYSYQKWDNFIDSDEDIADSSGISSRESVGNTLDGRIEERHLQLAAFARRADALFNAAEAAAESPEQQLQDYETALGMYSDVLEAVAEQLEVPAAAELAVSAGLNSSCVCIRLQRWNQAVLFSEQALHLHRSQQQQKQQQKMQLLNRMKLLRAHYFKAHALLMQSKAATAAGAKKLLQRAISEAKNIRELLQQSTTTTTAAGEDDVSLIDDSQRTEYERLCAAIEQQASSSSSSSTHRVATTATEVTTTVALAEDAIDEGSYGSGDNSDGELAAVINRGQQLAAAGKLQEAAHWYELLLDHNNNNNNNNSNSNNSSNSNSSAMVRARQLLLHCPSDQLAELRFAQATALQQLGLLPQAGAAYIRCSELVEDAAARAKLSLRAAALLFKAQKFKEAFDAYSSVLQSASSAATTTPTAAVAAVTGEAEELLYYAALCGQATCLVKQQQQLALAECNLMRCIDFYERRIFLSILPQLATAVAANNNNSSSNSSSNMDTLLLLQSQVLQDLSDVNHSSDYASTADGEGADTTTTAAATALAARDTGDCTAYSASSVVAVMQQQLQFTAQQLLNAYAALQDCAAAAREWNKCDAALDRTIDCTNAIVSSLDNQQQQQQPQQQQEEQQQQQQLLLILSQLLRKHRAVACCGKARLFNDKLLQQQQIISTLNFSFLLPVATSSIEQLQKKQKRYNKFLSFSRLLGSDNSSSSDFDAAAYVSLPATAHRQQQQHQQQQVSAAAATRALWSYAAAEFCDLQQHRLAYEAQKSLAQHWMLQAHIAPFELDAAHVTSTSTSTSSTTTITTTATATADTTATTTTTTTATANNTSTTSSTSTNTTTGADTANSVGDECDCDGLAEIAEYAHDAWRQCALIVARQIEAALAEFTCHYEQQPQQPQKQQQQQQQQQQQLQQQQQQKQRQQELRHRICSLRQQAMLAYYFAGICAYHFDITLSQRSLESAQCVQREIEKYFTSRPSTATTTSATTTTTATTTAATTAAAECAAFEAMCGDLSYHLGQVYIRLGRVHSALIEAESALRHYSSGTATDPTASDISNSNISSNNNSGYNSNNSNSSNSSNSNSSSHSSWLLRERHALGLKALAHTIKGDVTSAEEILKQIQQQHQQHQQASCDVASLEVASLQRTITQRKQQLDASSTTATTTTTSVVEHEQQQQHLSKRAQRLAEEFNRGGVLAREQLSRPVSAESQLAALDCNLIAAYSILCAVGVLIVAILVNMLSR